MALPISYAVFHRLPRFKQVSLNTTKLTIVEDIAFEKRQFLFIVTSTVVQSSGTGPVRSYKKKKKKKKKKNEEAKQYSGACPGLRVVGVVWVKFITFRPYPINTNK